MLRLLIPEWRLKVAVAAVALCLPLASCTRPGEAEAGSAESAREEPADAVSPATASPEAADEAAVDAVATEEAVAASEAVARSEAGSDDSECLIHDVGDQGRPRLRNTCAYAVEVVHCYTQRLNSDGGVMDRWDPLVHGFCGRGGGYYTDLDTLAPAGFPFDAMPLERGEAEAVACGGGFDRDGFDGVGGFRCLALEEEGSAPQVPWRAGGSFPRQVVTDKMCEGEPYRGPTDTRDVRTFHCLAAYDAYCLAKWSAGLTGAPTSQETRDAFAEQCMALAGLGGASCPHC